mgnify:CR=1 FL=1
MTIVLNIGIVLSFFLAILLFSKKGKSLTDNILSFWLLIIGIHLTGYFLYYKGYWDVYPNLIGITAPLPLFYGPFLYLYSIHSIKKKSYLSKFDYIHFLPALFSYILMSNFFFFYSADEKNQVYKGIIDDYNGTLAIIILIGIIISGITYTILAYLKLVRRELVIKNNFSNNQNINLNWLKLSILGIGFVFLTVLIVTVLREVIAIQFPFNADILFYTIIVGFVFFIGYSGIRQQDLFSNNVLTEKQLVKNDSSYKKSGLKTETAVLKHKELLKIMEAEKPYLNPKLTLKELSSLINLSSNNTSQLINQYEQQNFYDFVNKYRVKEFISRAKNNKEFSLLAHAFDSGFNSKSTFNSIFKKFKLETPSQFLSKNK